MIRITLLRLLTCLGCIAVGFGQNIQVDDTYSAQQLIENVLVNSPCATVSNFQSSGDPYSIGNQSFGYFDATGTSFPFSNGIVLATSRAISAEGPNVSLIDEGNPAWAGDTDLNQALNISNTFNATILEFDFIPLTSRVSFDYIFASEEYQGSAPCRYSDGFAFLLKKSGTSDPYQNLAVLPNSATPVLVTSVHPAISGSCVAQNEQYFAGFNNSSAPINLNGQTVPLTAIASVEPGVSYHIKLVIADHENIRYDSAIFLSGGSFRVGTDIGPDRLLSSNNPVCAGTTYDLDATEASATAYKWFRNGIAIAGATNPVYSVSSAGLYAVEVTLGISGCVAAGEANVEFSAGPNLLSTTIAQCDQDGNGIAEFNLRSADPLIINGNPDVNSVTYYPSMADANASANSVVSDIYSSGNATIYAKGSNQFGCSSVVAIQLSVVTNIINNTPVLETCDYDPGPVQDGFYRFTLSDADSQVLAGLPSGLIVQYYETENDALLHPENLIPATPYTNALPNNQTIYARIANGPGCFGIIPVNLIVKTLSMPNFESEDFTVCEGHPATLSVSGIYDTYNWSNGDTDSETTISEPGNYTVTVTRNGCSVTKSFTTLDPSPPVITSVDIDDNNGNQNTVVVNYAGSGNYEFSIDGVTFQDSNVFSNVAGGEYIISIRDKAYCGIDSEEIIVIGYPKFFTPNSDGINDYWMIPSYMKQPGAIFSIFDRYGKLLSRFMGNDPGWDGRFRSRNLPATDYWFTLTSEKGKTIRGHFSLIR